MRSVEMAHSGHRQPAPTRAGELPEVIQTAFGWSNSHLHQFEIGTTIHPQAQQIGCARSSTVTEDPFLGLAAEEQVAADREIVGEG